MAPGEALRRAAPGRRCRPPARDLTTLCPGRGRDREDRARHGPVGDVGRPSARARASCRPARRCRSAAARRGRDPTRAATLPSRPPSCLGEILTVYTGWPATSLGDRAGHVEVAGQAVDVALDVGDRRDRVLALGAGLGLGVLGLGVLARRWELALVDRIRRPGRDPERAVADDVPGRRRWSDWSSSRSRCFESQNLPLAPVRIGSACPAGPRLDQMVAEADAAG